MPVQPLLNESELLEHLRNGSHEAFTTLYRHYSEPVYYAILAMVKDGPAAEELVQEIFTRIWQRHAEIQIRSSFAGYLFRMSRNQVHDFFRKLNREQEIYERIKNLATEEYLHVEEALLSRENAVLLQQAIGHLPPQRRRAFELCKMEGLSYAEVGEAMGISLSTVRDHMAHARQSLREYLTRHPEAVMALALFLMLHGG